ncbi:hypothetical protein NQZ79_g4493 [Umbelopsis isabellina]|nr:hypothetical protein NQZ79_g4493 [Umbelopsis isabellina]
MKFTLFHAASFVLAIASVSALPRPRTNADANVPNQVKAVKVVDTFVAKSDSMPVSKAAQPINKDLIDDIVQDLLDDMSNLADDIIVASVHARLSVDDNNIGDNLALLNLLDIIKSLSSQITAVTNDVEKLDSQGLFDDLLLSVDHAGSLLMAFENGLEGQNYPDVNRYTDKFVKASRKFKNRILSLKNTIPSKSDDIVLDEFDDLDIAAPTITAMVKRQEPRRYIQSKEHIYSVSAVKIPKAMATHAVLPQEVIDAFAEFDDSRPEVAEMAEVAEEAAEEATPTPTMI